MKSKSDLGQLAEALEGIPVWGCLPGSPAERAGIRYGDVVLSVNGNRTRTVDDYAAALDDDRDDLEVVVFRDGAEHRLVLPLTRRPNAAAAAAVAIAARQIVEGRMLPTEGVPNARSAS